MRRSTTVRTSATACLSLLVSLVAVAGMPGSAQSLVPAGASTPPTPAHSMSRVALPRPARGAAALRLLGEQVGAAAALNEMTPVRLSELLRTDPSLWLDPDGIALFKDEPAAGTAADATQASAPLDQTFQLHSKSGSQHTVYLDFDGGVASATRWHEVYPGTPMTQPAWDPSADGPAFNASELARIQTVWQSVAEDYAPFDVDVTTADPGGAAIVRSSLSDQTFGSHVLITPSAAAVQAICGSGCGGVAYLGVFDAVGGAGGDGYGYRQPAWVFPQELGNSAKNVAEAVSHEVGHNLGLSHDGGPSSPNYDNGHGAWAPIMGVGYYHPISQWSKGDYAGATNTEDDFATIKSVTGARQDEAGTSIAGATAAPANTAYITRRLDVDTYLLGTCSGSVSVSTSALASLGDLDVKLSILDAAGQTVATVDPASAQTDTSVASGMSASLTQTLAQGTYYASVDGVGNGGWDTGYDDYASLGAYTIASTGCDGLPPTGTPSAPSNTTATAHPTDPSATVSWMQPLDSGSSPLTGYILTRSGSDTPVQLGPSATTFVWTGLESSTAYTFTVTALNARGPGPSASAGATTAAGVLTPGAPQNVTSSWDSLRQYALCSWSAPASSGSSAVRQYDVFVDGVYKYYTASSPISITALAPGTHTIGVAAVNSVGRGPVTNTTVVTPPRAINDAFAQRIALTGASGSVNGDNLESSKEGSSEPLPPATRSGAGGASVWYSWAATASGPVTMSTSSTVANRDTTLAVYTGTAVGALALVAGNDEPGGSATRLATVQFTATAGTTYAIAIDGYRTNAEGVGPFGLAWTNAPPAAVTATALSTVVNGRSAGLTATVAGAAGASGTVKFRESGTVIGSVPLAGGSASLQVDDLLRGTHSFTAEFVPTDASAFGTSQSTASVVDIAATPTATTLTSSLAGQSVTLSAGVTPAVAGTLTFRDAGNVMGSSSLSAGTAQLTLSGLPTGSHTYSATFVPADDLRSAGSTSATQTVVVPARATTAPAGVVASSTKLTAPRKARVGSRPVIKVTVVRGSAPARGRVVVIMAGRRTTLTLTAGQTQLKLPKVRLGRPKVVVRYLGDASTAASSATKVITVVA